MLDSEGKPIQNQPHGVRLTCDVAVQTTAALRIHFELTNRSSEPIHVFDNRGLGDLRPDLLCDGGGGAVHVLFGVPCIPPGLLVAWKYHPGVTLLAPGAAVRRESTLRIPLRERNPYYPAKYDSYSRVKIGRLVLRVDFLRASKVTDNQYPDAPRGEIESVSCEAPLPEPIELQRRADDFDRI